MSTFSKEISFLSLTLNPDKISEDHNGWEEIPTTKVAIFNDLSRRDKKQHKLHFAIVSLFSRAGTENENGKQINLDSDEIYDITVRAIKDLLIIDEKFTEADKKELLADSGALIDFGFWLIGEKIIPFFQNLMSKPNA